ncbi:MAG: hypothetical protein NC343_06270 [Muribaculum sp.]|nr:hypothetical protein [Muribaculaceae bacterium]MCM1081338.1 hypothetical protein [Muribaculum sp.]
MKQYILILISTLLLLSCSKEKEEMIIRDTFVRLNVAVQDKDGNDLLNTENPDCILEPDSIVINRGYFKTETFYKHHSVPANQLFTDRPATIKYQDDCYVLSFLAKTPLIGTEEDAVLDIRWKKGKGSDVLHIRVNVKPKLTYTMSVNAEAATKEDIAEFKYTIQK